MPKIKTSELADAALDWAVAKCEGTEITFSEGLQATPSGMPSGQWEMYSTNWAQGGPIIEREGIDVFTEKGTPESWFASVPRYQNGERLYGWRIHKYGPTPLVAAMRCYVASKLGDEVDVPDELLP